MAAEFLQQFGSTLSMFDSRRGFIGMPSASFWSRRNSGTANAPGAEIGEPEIGCDCGGDARRQCCDLGIGQPAASVGVGIRHHHGEWHSRSNRRRHGFR
jgi:hypothetical protein